MSTQQGPESPGANCNVYVASLPLHFDDDQLFALFSPYGRITSARIMRSKGARQSRGYGFVLYKDPSSAELAISSLLGCVIDGSRIQVRMAHPGASVAYNGQRGSRSENTTPHARTERTPSLQSPAVTQPLLPRQSAFSRQHDASNMMLPTYPVTAMYPTMYPQVVPQMVAPPQTPTSGAVPQVVFVPQFSQQLNPMPTPTVYMMVPDTMQAVTTPTLA
uniref:Uncharacterized protein TCIL3000_11_12740 n=1 Tax=Trypanosoma congolense (strain IL3000) TaxID=1068625 RepID=G0V2A6_TRYCI|nr:unnamed protein product [Trypanosoma congolense IL3000]